MKFETCAQLPTWILMLSVFTAVGCGGNSAESGHSASHEEITTFLQENPEFAKPASAAEGDELGLGQ